MPSTLIPDNFPEANIEFKKPSSMTDEECSSLYAYKDEVLAISKWKTTFWERVKFVFTGELWLGVMQSGSMPPVWLRINSTPFDRPTPSKKK